MYYTNILLARQSNAKLYYSVFFSSMNSAVLTIAITGGVVTGLVVKELIEDNNLRKLDDMKQRARVQQILDKEMNHNYKD